MDPENEFLASAIVSFVSKPDPEDVSYFEKTTPTDFLSRDNQKIFTAMQECLQKSGIVTLFLLHEKLGNRLTAQLAEQESAWQYTPLREAARVLREKSINRKIKSLTGENASENIAELQRELKDLEHERITLDASEHALSAVVRRSEDDGLPTSFRVLDRNTKRLKSGHFWVIGGYSNTGKTTFALQILNNIHNRGKVAFISLEMEPEDLCEKLMEIKVREYRESQAAKNYTQEQLEGKAIDDLKGLHIAKHLYSISAIERYVKEHSFDVVFIDYMQIIEHEGKSEYERMSEIARRLQKLAHESQTCVVVLSQVAEDFQKQSRNVTAGFKGSGSIASCADVGIILRRFFDEEETDVVPFYLILRKNRYGVTGKFQLSFDRKQGYIF